MCRYIDHFKNCCNSSQVELGGSGCPLTTTLRLSQPCDKVRLDSASEINVSNSCYRDNVNTIYLLRLIVKLIELLDINKGI